MRRIVVFLILLAVSVPVAASAATRPAGDGTLAVRDLNGRFAVYANGGIAGRCDRCFLRVTEWREEDPIDPRVVGDTRSWDVDGDGDIDRYLVRDGRWKIIGASFRIIVSNAVDADISLVGRGHGSIRGTAGTYSLNGSEFVAVPAELKVFMLRTLP